MQGNGYLYKNGSRVGNTPGSEFQGAKWKNQAAGGSGIEQTSAGVWIVEAEAEESITLDLRGGGFVEEEAVEGTCLFYVAFAA